MLITLGVLLLILWIVGVAMSYTLGGFIHLLLIAAIVIFLIRIICGETGMAESADKNDRRSAN